MIIELDFKQVGSRIRSARQEAGLTQEQLAEITGLSNEWVCQLEKGKKIPLETLVRFSYALGKDPNYFLMDTVYVPKEELINREIAEKLVRCDHHMLTTVNKILDVLLAHQKLEKGEKADQ